MAKCLLILVVTVFVFLNITPMIPAVSAQTPEWTQNPDIHAGLCAGANLDVNDPNCAKANDATVQINHLIHTVINLLSVIVGVVAVIMIIVGGLRYITSGGSDTGVTSAKNTILYAIIGLIIVALAQVLVRFVLRTVTNA